jgi:hypothetical protein
MFILNYLANLPYKAGKKGYKNNCLCKNLDMGIKKHKILMRISICWKMKNDSPQNSCRTKTFRTVIKSKITFFHKFLFAFSSVFCNFSNEFEIDKKVVIFKIHI